MITNIKNLRLINCCLLLLSMSFISFGQQIETKNMSEKFRILKEEFPCKMEQINEIEKINNVKFPDDYKDFLLKYNGGAVVPNYPKSENSKVDIFPLERFFSVGDIKIISSSKYSELRELITDDYNDELFDLNPEKLVFIGQCERGNLLIYCGEDDFGRICYANYSGGNGIEKTSYQSIFSLLNSLTSWDEEPVDLSKITQENFQSRKIFEMGDYFFDDNYDSTLALQRFKEVLSFYGDPNKFDKRHEKDVVQFYINNPAILSYLESIGAKLPSQLQGINNIESLKFLISKGVSSNGLLNSTRNLEVIKFLVEEVGHDLNKPFEGKYPLLEYAHLWESYSLWSRSSQYVLIQGLLKLGYDLDLNIKDENGQSVKEKIAILEVSHKKYTEKMK